MEESTAAQEEILEGLEASEAETDELGDGAAESVKMDIRRS